MKLLILLILIVIARWAYKRFQRSHAADHKASQPQIGRAKINDQTGLKAQLKTVLVFTRINTKRFFRDRLAQFFTVLFPLIFLLVFGSLMGSSNKASFKVALVNESHTSFSQQFVKQFKQSGTFKVDTNSTTLRTAKQTLSNGQLDGIVVLSPNFGKVQPNQSYPSGKIKVIYTEDSSNTGQTLIDVLNSLTKRLNSKFIVYRQPFQVTGQELNQKSLTAFDYVFSGLLGFSIIGIGIFGPVNVFPELKKQGILRRLHTTPLRVWQYFTATMLSQSITGLASIIIQFIAAVEIFHLKIDGNYLEILVFTIFSIFLILGIGLAIGGWARNERQAAPLSNIIVFPMMFLSGTFFPRYIMPDWLQSITNYLPLTPVIDGLRQLTTQGKNLTDIGSQLLLMVVWFIVIYVVAFKAFRWD